MPTSRFNEQAFVRPFEQRKRTFMETAYGIPNEYNTPTPGMFPPNAGGSQALASGFETLNLNQLPANNHEMMTYLLAQNSRGMPPPPSQMPRYQHHQTPPMHMRGKHEHNGPGRGRHDHPYQTPYHREDNYY
uniref:Uncharacterized protein n=1 Tax=Panagrolaimus sp. ES5 TaxID=591445 RepID=A0AC34GJC5_9BILA